MKYLSKVVSGQGRGKFLGYPTLNLVIPDHFSYQPGIYAGWVWIQSHKYPGAFHFGPVPTFDQSQPTLEVFILNTTLENTPQTIEFELVEYLREIISFKTSKELSTQIAKDVSQVSSLLQ